jgi:uncharacterized protein (DUF433 family)
MDVHLTPALEQKLTALAAVTGRAPEVLLAEALTAYGASGQGALDWSQCPAVESIPGKVSGAWLLKDTRMPVAIIFANLEAGMSIDEVMEQFDVTRAQVNAVLEFVARSLDKPPEFAR